MVCKGFRSLSGCSECTIQLSDIDALSNLNTNSIMDLICSIIDILLEHRSIELLSKDTCITCTGNLLPVYIDATITDVTKYNRELCCYILTIWYKHHKAEIPNALRIIYLSMTLSSLLDTKSNTKSERKIDNFSSMMTNIEDISLD